MNLAFVASFVGGLLATQNAAAFSPPASRSKVLQNLLDIKMTGAGGAATPDTYVEGE